VDEGTDSGSFYRLRKNSKGVIPRARFVRGICFFLGIGGKSRSLASLGMALNYFFRSLFSPILSNDLIFLAAKNLEEGTKTSSNDLPCSRAENPVFYWIGALLESAVPLAVFRIVPL
jgi:hypothetical protein